MKIKAWHSRKNAVWNKTGGRCWYCGKHLLTVAQYESFRDRFVLDHAVPKCQGGTDDIENLLPACWSCNSEKSGRTIEEYRVYASFKHAGVPYFNQQQLMWLNAQGFKFNVQPILFWGEQ